MLLSYCLVVCLQALPAGTGEIGVVALAGTPAEAPLLVHAPEIALRSGLAASSALLTGGQLKERLLGFVPGAQPQPEALEAMLAEARRHEAHFATEQAEQLWRAIVQAVDEAPQRNAHLHRVAAAALTDWAASGLAVFGGPRGRRGLHASPAFALASQARRRFPAEPLDARRYSPQIVDFFAAAGEHVEKRAARGRLEVQVDRPGELFLDGRPLGPTPQHRVHEVPAGLYHLWWRDGTKTSLSHRVEVPARGQVTVHLELDVEEQLLLGAGFGVRCGGGCEALLLGLGRQLKVDTLLAVGWQGHAGQGGLRLWRVVVAPARVTDIALPASWATPTVAVRAPQPRRGAPVWVGAVVAQQIAERLLVAPAAARPSPTPGSSAVQVIAWQQAALQETPVGEAAEPDPAGAMWADFVIDGTYEMPGADSVAMVWQFRRASQTEPVLFTTPLTVGELHCAAVRAMLSQFSDFAALALPFEGCQGSILSDSALKVYGESLYLARRAVFAQDAAPLAGTPIRSRLPLPQEFVRTRSLLADWCARVPGFAAGWVAAAHLSLMAGELDRAEKELAAAGSAARDLLPLAGVGWHRLQMRRGERAAARQTLLSLVQRYPGFVWAQRLGVRQAGAASG